MGNMVPKSELDEDYGEELDRLQLDEIFASFYSPNQNQIDAELAEESYFDHSVRKVYYDGRGDGGTWKSTIQYCYLCYKGTRFKAVRIKFQCRGSVIESAWHQTPNHARQRLEENEEKLDYSLAKEYLSPKVPRLLAFVNKLGLTTHNPAYFYVERGDALNIVIKDLTKLLFVSVVYRRGSPTFDFDDYWEDGLQSNDEKILVID
jgi:hypothetical protein